MMSFKKWQKLPLAKKEYYRLHLENEYESPLPHFGWFIAVTAAFMLVAAAWLLYANNIPGGDTETATLMAEAMTAAFRLYGIVALAFIIVIICYSIWRIYHEYRFRKEMFGK